MELSSKLQYRSQRRRRRFESQPRENVEIVKDWQHDQLKIKPAINLILRLIQMFGYKKSKSKRKKLVLSKVIMPYIKACKKSWSISFAHHNKNCDQKLNWNLNFQKVSAECVTVCGPLKKFFLRYRFPSVFTEDEIRNCFTSIQLNCALQVR